MDNDFGKKVRYYRVLRNKTQKDLSDYLGYKTPSSVAKIEDGTNDVPLSVVEQIATFLRVDIIKFFDPLPEDANEYAEYEEFLPYLAKTDPVTLKNVRLLLGMPMEKKSGNSAADKIS